ncbi:unnamed protein product [Sphagnum tenellum]
MASVMGIQGLLPALKSIMTPGRIRDHARKRAATLILCCTKRLTPAVMGGLPRRAEFVSGLSPTGDLLLNGGTNLGVKKRKPFVSPSLLNGPFHVTTGFKVRMFATHSTLSVKRSGYFSHSSPQPWELTSPDTPTGQEENGVDGFGDCDLDILKELQLPAVANVGLAE